MAGNIGSLTTSAAVSSTTSVKTILQLVAPANQSLRVQGFGVFFQGVSVTDSPIVVELLRQTTAGTATARNPLKRGISGTAIQATGQENASAEPTASDILWSGQIHPQAGAEIPLIGREILMDGGTRLGLRVTAAVAVNVRAHIDYEE
jgi:hypothetical protein